MRLCIYFLAFVHLNAQVRSEQSQNELYDTLKNKIHELQQRQLKEVITPHFRSKFVGFHEEDPYWKFASGISMFNQDFIMLENDFHSFTSFENFDLKSVAKIIEGHDRISVAELVEYGNIAILMLIVNKEEVRILKFESGANQEFEFRDVQEMEHVSISDAKMFRVQNRLFMAIANDKGSNIALFSLYEWSGSNFYEKGVLPTKGIPQIEAFEHDGKAIILMLHKRKGLETICDVFEYDDEKFNKIQELKFEAPRHIIPYEVNNDKYVLVFSAWKRHFFSWTGERLVEISTESTHNNDYQKVKLTTINNVTLVFASKRHKVDIFMLSSQGAIFLTTQNYLHSFTLILSVDHFKINETDYLVVIGNVGVEGILEYYKIELTGTPEIGNSTPTADPLAICLGLLQGELEDDNTNLNLSKKNISAQKEATMSMASYTRQSNSIEEIESLLFDEDIEDIDRRLMDILNITEDFVMNAEDMEINGDIVVEGKVTGKELNADSLKLQFINQERWSPNQWLSYTKNQTIAGGKDAENLIVKELLVTAEIDLLKDLLLNNSDVKIGGSFTIDNLITNELMVDEINNIKMEDVFMRGRDDIIRGVKTITNLTSNSIEALNIQKPNRGNDNGINGIRFAPHVFIDDLKVKYIDGVDWKKFSDSVFRYGITQQISGNIKMKAFGAKNLYAKRLNGVETTNLMTRTTDQTVNSTIDIEQTHMKNYMAVNFINNLNPSEIVTVKDPSVKGPVSIQKMRLLGKLVRNYSTSDKDHPTVGTKESDLVQFYHKVIKINGNLLLKNFRNLDSLRIIVGEEHEEFNPNFPEKYWMKNVNQVIPVHVDAKGGIKTPHLQTRILNQNNFTSFLLNNTVGFSPTNFDFENVTFSGNIHLVEGKTHSPNLKKIDSEAVRINGSFLIQGKKVFQDTLKIQDLIADELNGVDKKNLVTRSQPASFNGSIIFENLVVNGNLKSKSFKFDELNGFKLDDLKKNTIYIDRPQELENLSFTSITANNLDIENINGRPINEYLAKVNDALNISVIDSLIINGKLAIGYLSKLSKINDKQPDLLFANRLKLDDRGVFHGNVRFSNNVTIDQLAATIVNGINFRELVNSILYRNGNQTITAKYTFGNLKTRNLVAPKINEHEIDPLVDIKSKEVQKIIAFKGANFKRIDITKLYAEKISPCDIARAFDALKSPPTQTWSRITVLGNVTIIDEENPLYDILENAVLLNQKNILTAPVYFNNVSAENVDTIESINNVNLTHIFSDALLKKSKTQQIVSGVKFLEQLNISSATVYNNSDIAVVNGVDFPDIFSRIIPKRAIDIMPITGRKTFFAGLQTERLQSRKVSNVIPETIVTVDKIQNVTSAKFESIELKKMSVDFVNGQNFHHFMNERVLLDGPPIQELQGFYTFRNVEISGDVEVPEINNVDIHDIVFDVHNQTIGGKKTFVNDVNIHGNVNINMLNGRFISEIYSKALLKNEESFIDSNVKIMRPSYANGTIITDSINGYPLEDIRRCLNSGMKGLEQQQINTIIRSMEQTTSKSYKLIERMSSEILYLEKSNVIQLSLENVLDAQVFRLKDYVLIHIIGEEDGTVCQLPKSCKCPVQYTVQISPENSVNTFFSKGSQRVYSYDDKKMTAHLITNSVSTDAICRRNSTKSEVTSFSWSKATEKNKTGTMFSETIKFTGYISAVEYFSIEGATYAIIGKYYDPEKNSYDLDCIVYKFSEDRTKVSEIQRIETKGLWVLKIFYTPQGVVLIIGMLGDKMSAQNSEKTLVMRFNQDFEKFFLLREVKAYGCSSASGILLESDNFIALTHKLYPALIFKYDHLQDNYVYYQNLWDSIPIRGISLFYSGHYGKSEPYLCVTSKKGTYSIYTYQYIKGWQRKFFNKIEGLRNLVPFELNDKLYLFALSSNVSSILTVVKYRSD